MKKKAIYEFCEIISDPVTFGLEDQIIVQHVDLPEVNDELSVSLQLQLKSHSPDWATIFHKGADNYIRTPSLWLTPNKSISSPQFTGNYGGSIGLDEVGDALLLNRWYHLTYTLSDSKKRLDFYINGEWVGFYCIQNVQTQKVMFNDGPIWIGYNPWNNGINGNISNFRYFNWRLSAKDVMKNYLDNNQYPFNTLTKIKPKL